MPGISEATALEAHCRRVAGWATEFAHSMSCSTGELDSLEKAALLHHCPPLLLRPQPLERIASDMHVQLSKEGPAAGGDDELLAILLAYHGFEPASARTKELTAILDWADQFDEEFELSTWDPLSPELRSERFEGIPKMRMMDPAVVRRASHNLPVFPTIAQRAMRLMAAEDVSFEQVERAIGSDQVLAAELLRAANSAMTGARQPVRTIPAAIGRIGVAPALRIICASCIRPVFASRSLYDLWNHSLEAAQVAEEFALLSKRVDPAEAFLAALIHDIGRLAFSLLSCDYQVRSQRLLEYGCPALLVEKALTGTNHAEIGAELLREWMLPAQIVDAIHAHHNPAQSSGTLAALLYVTELRTLSDEDLPSRLRLEQALKVLEIDCDVLLSPRIPEGPALGHLKFAAAS